MASLLEAAAAVGISGTVMVLVTTSLAGAARIQSLAATVANDLFAARQLEQLVDRASLMSGYGPAHSAAVSSVSADTVVFGSDANGDGLVDSTSSETTALEIRPASGRTSVRVRLGRQTMTVLDAGDGMATLFVYDVTGRPASAGTARLVDLEVTASQPLLESDGAKHMLFSLPARTMP